jgi:hypothetical protein
MAYHKNTISSDTRFAKIEKGWQRYHAHLEYYKKMQKENEVAPIQGLFIDRHDFFGETPNHRDYSKMFTKGNEYKFDWGTDEIAGDSK